MIMMVPSASAGRKIGATQNAAGLSFQPGHAVGVVRPLSLHRSVMPPRPAGHGADLRVVAIGASAGGLEACIKLLDALPGRTGMAFVLVQHLDPSHPSMLVELLAGHTSMTVLQADAGVVVQPNHLYVIPPATYLSIRSGVLRLSSSSPVRGARLPFDFLLASLAAEYAGRAICVVLSGNGADGTRGLCAVSDAGGLVLAQDPDEAGHDGMPRSAMATGRVDTVARVADIAGTLSRAARGAGARLSGSPSDGEHAAVGQDPFREIIGLLRSHSRYDFAPYKRGTLERRIERRMGLALGASPPGVQAAAARAGTHGRVAEDLAAYLARLRTDTTELDFLAKDLFIHVTSFFRDPAAFDALARQVVPDLLQNHPADQPVRIWVAGCSTGEEVYSLIMLFREAALAQPDGGADARKLQVFASDIDSAAIATAREGLYPAGIEADVSADRLAKFFSKEDGHGYRVLPDLRACVVFTVQDLLADPPFSRLDLVSCRNVMIYLGAEAQAKTVSLFHFALKTGGVLLLGSAETVGETHGRFALLNKTARVYRHVGRRKPGDLTTFAPTAANGLHAGLAPRAPIPRPPSRQGSLAELCRQAVLDRHAPAAVLCNTRYECLYSLGPTDEYLQVAPGPATLDLLSMARGTMRARLRSALVRALKERTRITSPGWRLVRNERTVSFTLDVEPLYSDGETLLLVCFVDTQAAVTETRGVATVGDSVRIAELERELETARSELEAGARTLEASGEQQRAINEDALSVSEEYQSANEELLTSKEELQSLNEELTALNSQLQETLERQRTTANDLQNILYSTDIATLFLDRSLNIRFFTPATRALFNVIPGDVGRPLADLHSLATDTGLPADAHAVMAGLEPIEREVETQGGIWFRRRILPYRAEANVVEGVVITFNDVTRRRQVAAALEEAKGRAEAANLAKSRFLAAASHDLRQPLQTLTLLQGLLANAVTGDRATGLVERLGKTLGSMARMLDTLLDLNQIEAGIVRADVVDVRVGSLLERLRDEFALQASAKGVAIRVCPSSAVIRTDPRLLEQMLRNLVTNALKYTDRGRILLGCRRQGATLRIEVWDTGIGIADAELQSVFKEYYQVGNEARERERGLGLGLSIVQRLGGLLGHRVAVRSSPGQGSVFTIEVTVVPDGAPGPGQRLAAPGVDTGGTGLHDSGPRGARILLIEDDPDLRDLLREVLEGEGHVVDVASSGQVALDEMARQTDGPDLLLADYNLPGGMTGLQIAARLRGVRPGLPVVILTGDISTGTLQDVTEHGFLQLNKPVKPTELVRVIGSTLRTSLKRSEISL